MQFVKVENIGDHEEMILNLDHISVLAKNQILEMCYSDSTPYPYVERKKKENEFEYIVLLNGKYSYKLNKEDYELIKSKIGV